MIGGESTLEDQTLCVTCDAPPGQCTHNAHRYHDRPVILHPKIQNGKKIGYTVDDADRERWDKPLLKVTPPIKPTEKPKPVEHLIAELEAWIDFTPNLEMRFRSVYAADPLRVTRATHSIVTGAETNQLTNPAGVLVTRLRDIDARI